jgi:predicted RecB family nuclease
MRRFDGQVLFSATDLVGFLGCRHATVLDRRDLDDPQPRLDSDPYVKLLQEKGVSHEQAYLERLRASGLEVVEITGQASLRERGERTRAAMASGVDVVYQGAFIEGQWHGFSDFLIRVEGESNLGSYGYEVCVR